MLLKPSDLPPLNRRSRRGEPRWVAEATPGRTLRLKARITISRIMPRISGYRADFAAIVAIWYIAELAPGIACNSRYNAFTSVVPLMLQDHSIQWPTNLVPEKSKSWFSPCHIGVFGPSGGVKAPLELLRLRACS